MEKLIIMLIYSRFFFLGNQLYSKILKSQLSRKIPFHLFTLREKIYVHFLTLIGVQNQIVYNYQFTMKQLNIKELESISYIRKSILGKGAYGQVYLGFDETRKMPCAIKMVNLLKLSQQTNAETLLKKIKEQIVNMQIIKNEYIIEFYQAKRSTNNIYIICEFCNGMSLAQLIKNRQYLTERETLIYLQEILKGFKYLHQNKIVHRDFKPANILLHNYSIKIADLGFSKITENHEQMLESIVGTPLYMSPQIFDRQGYTQKTDIWSLGAILFEMLYGKNPWAGSKNLFELKQKIRSQIVFPTFPYVSDRMKQTIKKMLKVQQSERISWERLFAQYLQENKIVVQNPITNGYFPASEFLEYFSSCFNLQSYLQMPKLAKQLRLLSEAQLKAIIGVYNSKQQFYNQLLFLTENEQLVNNFYEFYMEKHNEISFLVVLSQKVSTLASSSYTELSAYCNCLVLLIYRYCLSIIEQVYNFNRLILFDEKFQLIYGKLFHDKILLLLFHRSYQMIKIQYQRFLPFYQAVISRIKNHSIFSIIEKDLSGIYASTQNQKRALKFFLQNYLKRVFNILKSLVKAPKTMVSEQQESECNAFPSKQVTLIKMIQEYLNNKTLFKIIKELKGGKRNLSQMLHDWQTSIKQHFFQKLEQTQLMKEQSINTFLKKEIVWKPMFIQPQFI